MESKFKTLVNKIKPEITEIDAQQLKQKLNHPNNFKLIDVRETSEWEQGHLPNALHISKGVLERDIDTVASDINTEIILYCGGGSRSAIAAYSLQAMGYKNVLSLAGGYRGWVDAGYPVVS